MKRNDYLVLSFGDQQKIISEWREHSKPVGEDKWISFNDFLEKRKK